MEELAELMEPFATDVSVIKDDKALEKEVLVVMGSTVGIEA